MAFAIAACSNDAPAPIQDDELVHVTFNVNPFEVGVEPMAARAESRASMAEVVNTIEYILVNKSTKKIWNGSQTLAQSGDDFGKFELWIPKGTYNTSVIAYNKDGAPNQELQLTYDNSYNAAFLKLQNADCFVYTNNQHDITSDMESVDLNLNRYVGQLVLRLNDNVPDDIKVVSVSTNLLNYYNITTGKNEYTTCTLSNSMSNTNGNVAEWSVFGMPQTERILKITIYDDNNSELGSCNVTYNIYSNRRTIITGNLTDVITQTPLNVTINDEWGNDAIVPL